MKVALEHVRLVLEETLPFDDWKEDHPCPSCGRGVTYCGIGRPSKFCGPTCRRRASETKRAAERGLVRRELVVVRTVPDLVQLDVGERLEMLADLSGRIRVDELSDEQLDELSEVLWGKQAECRAQREAVRAAAQRVVLQELRSPPPRMLPGFGGG